PLGHLLHLTINSPPRPRMRLHRNRRRLPRRHPHHHRIRIPHLQRRTPHPRITPLQPIRLVLGLRRHIRQRISPHQHHRIRLGHLHHRADRPEHGHITIPRPRPPPNRAINRIHPPPLMHKRLMLLSHPRLPNRLRHIHTRPPPPTTQPLPSQRPLLHKPQLPKLMRHHTISRDTRTRIHRRNHHRRIHIHNRHPPPPHLTPPNR